MRTYQLTVRNRLAIGAMLLLGLGAGLLLVTLGLALVLSLMVGGAVLGTGMLAYRAITGRGRALPPRRDARLDPSLEVFPRRRELPRDADGSDGP
jgi:hypothetical protein